MRQAGRLINTLIRASLEFLGGALLSVLIVCPKTAFSSPGFQTPDELLKGSFVGPIKPRVDGSEWMAGTERDFSLSFAKPQKHVFRSSGRTMGLLREGGRLRFPFSKKDISSSDFRRNVHRGVRKESTQT